MPYPSIPNTAITNRQTPTSSTSTHVVNLPASISAGNLLIVAFVTGPNQPGDTTITWPANWLSIFTHFLADSSGMRLDVRYKIADGSEGATITITTSNDHVSGAGALRIIDHGAATVPPASGVVSTGTDANANPPSLNPAWGVKAVLWIAVATARSGATVFSGFPTNYNLSQLAPEGDNVEMGIAARQLTATSDDPGVFTNPNAPWIANTIAIHPALESPPSASSFRTFPILTTAIRLFPNAPAERTLPKVPTDVD